MQIILYYMTNSYITVINMHAQTFILEPRPCTQSTSLVPRPLCVGSGDKTNTGTILELYRTH